MYLLIIIQTYTFLNLYFVIFIPFLNKVIVCLHILLILEIEKKSFINSISHMSTHVLYGRNLFCYYCFCLPSQPLGLFFFLPEVHDLFLEVIFRLFLEKVRTEC